jgi:hypothetical protein
MPVGFIPRLARWPRPSPASHGNGYHFFRATLNSSEETACPPGKKSAATLTLVRCAVYTLVRWQVADLLAGFHFGDAHPQPRASRLELRVPSFAAPEIHFPTPASRLTRGGQGLPIR